MSTEKALIGTLLHKPDLLVTVSGIVELRDFKNPEAAVSYETILTMWRNREHVDLVSVSAKITDKAIFLSEAFDVIPISAAAFQYATEIAGTARAARIAIGLRVIQEQHKTNPQMTLEDIVSLYHRESVCKGKTASMAEVSSRFRQTLEKNAAGGGVGISTGFDFLENMGIRYRCGEIWVIGGFTSVGKTALMVEMLMRLRQGIKAVMISTEMTETQLMARLVANKSGFGTGLVLSGHADGSAGDKINTAISHIGAMELDIHDDIYTIGEIESAALRRQMRGGIDLVFVDYVQNCQVAEGQTIYQKQSILANRLQKLAKDLDATVVCLSQVSNSVGRGDVDQLEFKGAGEWASASDVSLILRGDKNDKRSLLCSVKKHRHGKKHGFSEGQILEYENNFTRIIEGVGFVTD